MATAVATQGSLLDLELIAAAIDDLRDELEQLYDERAQAAAAAWEDGLSQRDIGYALGISHTMVQKILNDEYAGYLPARRKA